MIFDDSVLSVQCNHTPVVKLKYILARKPLSQYQQVFLDSLPDPILNISHIICHMILSMIQVI
jgi:hypothetical protein